MADYILFKRELSPNRSYDGEGHFFFGNEHSNSFCVGNSLESAVETLHLRKKVKIDEKKDTVTTLPAPIIGRGRHDLIDCPVSVGELGKFIRLYRNFV